MVPPFGWTFGLKACSTLMRTEPMRVEFLVDGTDRCSKGEDIIFKFLGFSLLGKVSYSDASFLTIQVLASDGVSGQAGATVSLTSQTGQNASPTCSRHTDVSSPVRQATSTNDGSYVFSAVSPGAFLVSVSMAKAAFLKVCCWLVPCSRTGRGGCLH